MGLGSTARKLQKVADFAEDLYKRLNELRDQVKEMQSTVVATKERVERLEAENREQRALLEEIAREQGIDLDAVTAKAHIAEAERDPAVDTAEDAGSAATDADSEASDPDEGDGGSAEAGSDE